MAYIDSSTASPLSALPSAPDDEQLEPAGLDDEAQEEPHEPKPRKKADTAKQRLLDQIDDINLARYLPQDQLDQIGMDVVQEFKIDEQSREEWVETTKLAVKFATQKTEPKAFPWPGASNVIFPLLPQAALEFHARAYPAIIQSRKVVKGVTWGPDRGQPVTTDGKKPNPDGSNVKKDPTTGQPMWLVKPGEKRQRADRIADHMSYQLLEEIPEWEPQTDQYLLQMPVSGGFVRKTFYDPIDGRNCSQVVDLMNLVWNYHAPSFEAAPRHSERILLYPTEIETYERKGRETEDDEGMFLHLDYGPGAGSDANSYGYDEELQAGDQADPFAPHLYIEQHRRLDLDGDGYAEPYAVTVHLRSSKVVRITADYDEDDIETAPEDDDYIVSVEVDQKYTLYSFLPNIDGGSYPMGFGHLLRAMNETLNTTLNQMFDAGTLQNAGGGFISDQLGLPSGQTLFQVGKYVRVTTKGASIRESVFPIPFQGPSPVLFQLFGVLLEAGKQIASIGQVLAGDASIANAPPTTVLALIEQGMKVYTAIHKRIFRAEKAELAKLYELNRKHLKDKADYRVGDEWLEITEEDYRLGGGVEPIADPTMVTDMQKLGRAGVLMQFAADPTMNGQEIKRRYLEAANIERIDDLFAPPNPAQMQMLQMQMAVAQAQLGKLRSEEQKNATQALLNLALVRKNATAGEEAQLDRQLEFLRLQVEAVNASVRADAVRHEAISNLISHGGAHADRHLSAHLQAMKLAHEATQNALDRSAAAGADENGTPADPGPSPPMPTPGPSGPFPQAPVTSPGPAVTRPFPGGPPAPDDTGAP